MKVGILPTTTRSGIAPQTVPTPCMDCGSCHAILLLSNMRFDFDPSVIPDSLRPKFVDRTDGICFNCGLYQEFNRYSIEEMMAFAEFNKDETVSESAFKSYPVPGNFITDYDDAYFRQRVHRWSTFFDSGVFSGLRRSLFLRPMFGALPEFVASQSSGELYGLEISQVCARTTLDRVPRVQILDGSIHGYLDGDFLAAGEYDAIFVFHTMIHCVDIHDSLGKLSNLLADEGFIIFIHEIQLKPQNPFHMLFPTEHQFTRLLKKHFRSVDRIDDCDPSPPSFITNFSARGDSPDLVAWK